MDVSKSRKYYAQRKNTDNAISLDVLKQIVLDYFREIDEKGFFDEWVGEENNWGERIGGVTSNPESYVLRKLRKNLWPVHEKINDYSEDDLLTIVEFLHDHVSIHSSKYASGYDTEVAQKQFRDELNPVLADFGVGLELNKEGEIVVLEPAGMQYLLTANIPTPNSVDRELIATVDRCVNKFRARKTSIEERKSVLLELGGVFEALKDSGQLSAVLNGKDESAIFEFANKFAIRHRDSKQVNNYDKDIWLSWAFYYYLATIHAVLRMIQRQEMLTPERDDLWAQVLEETKRHNVTLYGVLRMAKPKVEKNEVSLDFTFMFHAKRIQQPVLMKVLQQAVKDVYGHDFTVKITHTKRTPAVN